MCTGWTSATARSTPSLSAGELVTTLATGQLSCVGIAIEGPNVYWVNSGLGNLVNGTVMRVGK